MKKIQLDSQQRFILWITGLFAIVAFLYVQNHMLQVTEIDIFNKKLPSEMDHYRIVQLSDLHSQRFGKDQHVLINKVRETNPDLIVYTGDAVDRKKFKPDIAIDTLVQLTKIAPVYYVTGNHEWLSGEAKSFKRNLKEKGIHVLTNEHVQIYDENGVFTLVGIDDPVSSDEPTDEGTITDSLLTKAMKNVDRGTFTLLLSHRPEQLAVYAKHNVDLVLTGHAHGGQVRLPFIGGLVAPNQGFLPTYTSGEYTKKQTTMIVNRGLGNSVIPQRLFNRPEIIVITLSHSSKKHVD